MKKFAVLTILAVVLIALVTPSSVFADAPVPVGGLWLDGYCQSQGLSYATMTKDRIGPNAAFNNWRCVEPSGALHPFSMEQACKWEYGFNAILTHPTDPDDAWTWVCYSVQH